MRSLSESERNRIFSESTLEEPSVPINVDPDLNIVDGFPIGGEAIGWRRGSRRINLHADALSASDDELRALVAHELGHHQGSHVLLGVIWKVLVVVFALGMFVAGYLAWLLTSSLVPLLVLAVAIVIYPPFVKLSTGWISRRLELAADRRAVGLLGSVEPMKALWDASEAGPRPSSLRERYYELCYPWPRIETRIDSLRSIDSDE